MPMYGDLGIAYVMGSRFLPMYCDLGVCLSVYTLVGYRTLLTILVWTLLVTIIIVIIIVHCCTLQYSTVPVQYC